MNIPLAGGILRRGGAFFMRRAFHALRSGRPGPVLVEMPGDVCGQPIPDNAPTYASPSPALYAPSAGAVGDAELFLKDHPETRARFDRVADLVEGFESSFGLELLATVHWVAAENPTATTEDVVAGTYAWDERKRQFSEGQIRLALDVLREKGWLAGYPAAGS
jgi:hypothetical protein